ncbi:MAG: hypothetical protein EA422_03400 [Gemmatimonadales bacterium]|nr:MAG: hypothetical protein EA422_03400 [Gemmatimonadales bacterium]
MMHHLPSSDSAKGPGSLRHHHRAAAILTLALAIPLAAPPAPAAAQYTQSPAPSAWSVENATLVQGDGSRTEGVTVVVRNGIIEALGPDVQPPADARRISWDEGTLYLYPGLIDGHGNAPTTFPTPNRENVESWHPTREVQNFTAHRRAADWLTGGGETLSDHRRHGVLASGVFPGRGPIPGQASFILHDPGARSAAQLVLEPSIGLVLSFQGAQGVYPATLMAVHAMIRQSFMDAEHHAGRMAGFAQDSRGRTPVAQDPDLDLLHRAAQGDIPVFFRADGPEFVRRVLSLSDEIGFRPVVVGAQGSGPLAEELARRDVPVLLSADLDSPSAWDPEDDGALSPEAGRERARLVPLYETAGELEAAGVRFAITSGGQGGSTLLSGVRRYMEYGLSEEGALRALTLTPAELMAAPDLGRIQEGMAATFIVTDRELLEEGVRVAWSFVNGHAEEGQEPRANNAVAEGTDDLSPGDVVGAWRGSLESDQIPAMPISIELRRDGSELAGEATGEGIDTMALQDIRIEGGQLLFTVPFNVQEMSGSMEFRGAVEGDVMRGTGSIRSPAANFDFRFTMNRTPGGDR